MTPITLFYAGLLALWFVILTARVILVRRSEGVSLGDGDNKVLARRIRGHANFAEYVPITLVVLGFFEMSGGATWAVHAVGLMLLAGRLLHGYAFSFTNHSPLRVPGMMLTLFSLISVAILALVQSFIL